MNVLLIGGSCSLRSLIMTRLHKEGHRIFLLTQEMKEKNPQYVFETYRFPYVSDSVAEVFESVRPDVTLFLGAFDPNAAIRTDSDAVRFFSGVMNLLVSFSMMHSGRFVYLSTSEIFEKSVDALITETEIPRCESPRALVLAQVEAICDSYRRNLELDVVTLRLDQLHHIPKNRSEATDRCSALCLQIFDGITPIRTENDVFSMLYEPDAVEFIYKLMTCKTHREGIYNLSSSEAVTEQQLLAQLSDAGLTKENVQPQQDAGRQRVLSNQRYREEFGMRFFGDAQKMTEQTLRYMLDHPDDFAPQNPPKQSLLSRILENLGWLIRVLIPYLENLICFIPFYILNSRAEGSRYFERLDFFLLYVLLFAVVYGQRQATFSALLATIGYCVTQMRSQSGFEVFASYNTYVWLAQLFIVGLVVGYMKDRLLEQRVASEEEENYLHTRISDIVDINKSNVRVKDSLQTQLINQDNSLGKVYEITSTLNRYLPEEVLFCAAEIMAKLMNTEDVAVYTVSNDTYARLFSATSDKAKSLGRSIRYRELPEMMEAIGQKKVFINRKMDPKLPMMANAIFEDDRMRIIVMAWGIPWEALTLGQANLMSVVSALIREAVLRATSYMAALESQRFENNVLKKDAFYSLYQAFVQARSRGLTDCAVLRYAADDAMAHVEALRSALRQSDYVGMLDDDALYLLLSNTSEEDAVVVQKRLAERGFDLTIVEGTAL